MKRSVDERFNSFRSTNSLYLLQLIGTSLACVGAFLSKQFNVKSDSDYLLGLNLVTVFFVVRMKGKMISLRIQHFVKYIEQHCDPNSKYLRF